MIKNNNDVLTLSLLGGGAHNTLVCLNKKNNNYDAKSLRN